MSERPVFSFKRSLVLSLMDSINELYPGVNHALNIYFDPLADRIRAHEYHAASGMLKESDPGLYDFPWEKERKNSSPSGWLSPEYFNEKDKSRMPRQKTIMDELDTNILLLRIRNSSDRLMDLLYLFLSKNVGLFQLEKDQSELTTREKRLIANLSCNFISVMQDHQELDKELFANFSVSFEESLTRAKGMEATLEQTCKNYGTSILEYCTTLLKEFSERYSAEFSLSAQALAKLKEYKGRFDLLGKVLEDAVHLAINLKGTYEGTVIVIEDAYIVFPAIQQRSEADPSSSGKTEVIAPRPYAKAQEILDRYEYAAARLKEKGLPLTGKNIGSFCSPPISHPAITDSLDKHAAKILYVMEEYPNKWPIIRTEFRSVMNLANRTNWRSRLKNHRETG